MIKKPIKNSKRLSTKAVAAAVLIAAFLLTGCPTTSTEPYIDNSQRNVRSQKKEYYPIGETRNFSNPGYDISPYTIGNDYEFNSQNISLSKSDLKVYAFKKLEKIDFESDLNIRGTYDGYAFDIVRCDAYNKWRDENGLDIYGYSVNGTMTVGYDYPYADGGQMRMAVMITIYRDPSDRFIIATNCGDNKVLCEFFGGKGSGAPTPTPVPTSCSMADFCDVPSNQYSLFMNKIDEIEASDPGKYKYNLKAVLDRDTERYYFVMAAHYEYEDKFKKTMWFVVLDGEIKQLDMIPENAEPYRNYARTYKEIKSLPYLVDTEELLHFEIDKYGHSLDSKTPFASTLNDGEYFGDIIGISEDGKSMLFKVGKPVIMSCIKLNTLNPGDPVGFKDFVFDHKEGSYYYVKSASMIYLNTMFFQQYIDRKGETDKAYLKNGLFYWIEDTVIVEVPLSNQCRIFDNSEYAIHYSDLPESWIENGSLIANTRFFKALKERIVGTTSNSGWLSGSMPVHSLIIKKGEATVIECDSPYDLMK